MGGGRCISTPIGWRCWRWVKQPVTADVADHLASCPPCQAELESMRDVVDLGRDTGRARDLPSPPPRVWDSIMRQILAESQLLSESQAAAIAGPSGRGPGTGSDPISAHRSDDLVSPVRRAWTGRTDIRRIGPTAVRRAGDPPPRRPETPTPSGGPGRDRTRILHATAIAVAAVVIGVAGTLGLVGLRDSDGTKLVSRTATRRTSDRTGRRARLGRDRPRGVRDRAASHADGHAHPERLLRGVALRPGDRHHVSDGSASPSPAAP